MTQLKKRTSAYLPYLIPVIFVLQPLMDILSYWMEYLSMGNTLTLLLRLGVLAFVAALGFLLTERKKLYLAAAGLCVLVFGGHVLACSKMGYLDIVYDLTNYIRIIQMPLFALCFITFMKANKGGYDAIEKGLVLNFWVISFSVILSCATKTYKHTYEYNGFGVLGWFATSNAQSAIMSILTPIVVMICYRRKNTLLLTITAALGFAQLYLLGTRLAFVSILVVVVGVAFTAIINRKISVLRLLILFVLAAACCGLIKQSPMYKNQNVHTSVMSQKQQDANNMALKAEQEGEKPEDKPELSEEELAERRMKGLRKIYQSYISDMTSRFGTDEVIKAYNYTSQISEITATRPKKIMFCEMLMEEHTLLSRVFGMELSRMSWKGNNYDVENDFHGIYFLYGWAGLGLMVLFIAYFVFLIAKALLKNFKRYFTLEAGAFGMAFCFCLVYAYCTAGILRRPNASFYLSVVLAVIYYLTQLREYPQEEEKKGLEKA